MNYEYQNVGFRDKQHLSAVNPLGAKLWNLNSQHAQPLKLFRRRDQNLQVGKNYSHLLTLVLLDPYIYGLRLF